MRKLSEQDALTALQRAKANYQSKIKIDYEYRARSCRTCPTPGMCCTDAHFVNVHITRLEAVAIRETLARTPRLTDAARCAVYARAHETVARYKLTAIGDTFKQTYSCPLFASGVGCLVHARAKPAPCVQHACYDAWEDVPPVELEWRAERRIEQLNDAVYGNEWTWLSVPVWLTLVDPNSNGAELARLSGEWSARRGEAKRRNTLHRIHSPKRRSLPVIR